MLDRSKRKKTTLIMNSRHRLFALFVLPLSCYLFFSFQGCDASLSLSECVSIALENHSAISNGEGHLLSAQADYLEASEVHSTDLTLKGGMFYSTGGSSGGFGAREEQRLRGRFFPAAKITASKLIYDFEKSKYRTQSAFQAVSSAQEGLQATRSGVILNVHVSYYNYLLSEYLLVQHEKHVDFLKKSQEQGQIFLEEGSISEEELSKMELDLGKAEVQLIESRGARRLLATELNHALGMFEADHYQKEFELEESLAVTSFEVDLSTSISEAIESRKDIKAMELRIQAENSSLQGAERSARPDIGAMGWAEPYRVDRGSSGNNSYGINYGIGLGLNWHILQRGTIKAKISKAKAKIHISRAELELLVQKVSREVQEAYHHTNLAEERMLANRKILSRSKKSLAIAQRQHVEGLSSPLQLQRAKLNHSDAEIRYVQSVYVYKIRRSKFSHVTGRMSQI